MFTAADHTYMAEALRLAEQGLYTTDPNPRVGCVIVKDGAVIGRGFHRKAGEAHAEVLALRDAGAAARGATVYVTLEPCSHFGRTPPCADALLAAGIARVVAAMQDPNPLVAGKGFAKLQAAGTEIAHGLLEAQARDLNTGFVSRMTHGRPWVRSKLAASLDGRTALAGGASRWITSEAAREDVQHWRARSSVILTGAGTLLADDPRLTVRLPGEWRQPKRVVVDGSLRTPPSARVLVQPGETCIATTVADATRHAPLLAAGAKILVIPAAKEVLNNPFVVIPARPLEVPDGGKAGIQFYQEPGHRLPPVRQINQSGSDGHVDLSALMNRLADMECNEVLVESGAGLNGALLEAGLVDEFIIYMAPCLLGDSARGMFRFRALDVMDTKPELRLTDVRMVGDDLRVIAEPVKVQAGMSAANPDLQA